MNVIPAIDILNGRAVQLRGGDPEDIIWQGDDPVAAAQRWWDAGAQALHLVDLGRVLRNENNMPIIEEILANAQGPVSVGGGLRTTGAIGRVLDARDDATVVVATRAWRQPDWLDHISMDFPGRVVVALELKQGTIAVRGWTQRLTLTLDEGLFRLTGLDLAGVLLTDIDREGRLGGPNMETAARAAGELEIPLIVSGGVSTLKHIEELREAGADACIVGTALYTDELDLAEAQAVAQGKPAAAVAKSPEGGE